VRIATAGLLALVLVGCHNHEIFPMDGTWARGGISGDHFGQVVMRISDDGTRVTGLACYWESGYTIYSDVQVTGQYPRVSYTVGEGNDWPRGHFEGGIIAPDEMHGTWSVDSYQAEWSFQPTAASAYEACRNGRR
jgi:hypothetical protein